MKVTNTTYEFDPPAITDEHMEWLKRRQLGIGGSDASVCLGVNKYKGLYSLFMEKVTEPIDECNEYMHWGNRLESIIVSDFLWREGVLGTFSASVELVHPDHKWCRANLDGLVKDDPQHGSFIVEAKNVSEYVKGGWGVDFIPEHIYAQCQHNMFVSQLELCACVALIGGHELQVYWVKRDEDYCATLITAESTFWHENVLKNKAPAPDGNDSKELDKQFPLSNGEELPPNSKIDLHATQIEDYNDKIKALNDEKEAQINAIKLIMGDNEIAAGHTHTAKWKTSKAPKRLNKKLLEVDHPGLLDKYSSEGKPPRRFTIG